MRLGDLLALVEAVDGAGGGGKERHVAEEGGRDDVAVEIERRDCRHYRVFSFTLSGIMLSAPRRP